MEMPVQLKNLFANYRHIAKEVFTLPKRDIFDFIKPYFYGTKLLFILNFTIERNQFLDGKTTVTLIDKIKTAFLYTVIFVLYVQQNSRANLQIKSNLEFLNMGSYLFYTFGSVLVLVTACLFCIVRNKYLQLLNKIYHIDQVLAALNFASDIDRVFKQSIVALATGSIYSWIGYVICIVYLKFSFFDLIMELLPAQLYMLIQSMYCTTIIMLYLRYKKLNECFRFLFLNPGRKYRQDVKPIDQYYYVHTFSSLHMELTECTVLTNVTFSFLIMLCVGICLVFTVFTCYSTYLVWADYEEKTMNIAIKNCIIDSMLIISFYFLVLASSLISKEGKETANILHLVANFTNDEKLLKKFLGFSLQITQVQPVATCGLFIFDWTLLFSTATALFTYLIILIQSSFD